MTADHRALIYLFLFMLQATLAYGQESPSLKTLLTGAPLGQHLEVWAETNPPEGGFPPEQAWQKATSAVPNYGLVTTPYWFRLSLQVDEPVSGIVVEVGQPLLDQVDMWLDTNGSRKHLLQFGDNIPFSERPVRQRDFVIRLDFPSPGNYQLIFRVQTKGSMQFPLSIWDDAEFHSESGDDYIRLGLYTGFILSVALYNAFIFFTTRERFALSFVGHIVAYLLFLVALTGLGFEYLWPDALWVQERATTFFSAVSALFACLFARDFLDLKTRSQRWLLMVNNLTLWLSGFTVAGTLLLPYQLSVEATILTTLVVCVATFVTGVTAASERTPSSILYLLGWAGVLAGVILHSLAKQGVILVTPITSNAAHIGSIWLVTLHSLGIALRFHETRKEHLRTEQRMYQAQRESLKARFQLQDAEIRRKQTEAENEAKSAFLATMSHEIRTPLNGVLGMVQLLSSTHLDPQQKRWLDTISSSGESLLTIVNDILDLSKMNSGRLELDRQHINLHELVHDCLRLYANQAKNKGLTITADFRPPLYSRIYTDPTRLRQILNNLLSNAIKFTNKGSVQVTISTDGQALTLSVLDTGIGIPQAFHDKVFHHFSQAEASTSRTYGGTGLGLSICRQLTQLLGGSIGFRSEEGTGTEFTLTLPDVQPAEPVAITVTDDMTFSLALSRREEQLLVSDFLTRLGLRPATDHCSLLITDRPADVAVNATRVIALVDDPQQALPVQQILLRPLSTAELACELTGRVRVQQSTTADRIQPLPDALIWVAEDNAVNQKVISGMLRFLGLRHHLFGDGRQICDAWAAGDTRPDLILMDCEMPVMDGFDATRWLRTPANAGTNPVPVIALSAHVLSEYQEKARQSGFDDFLSKPIDRNLLRATLARWLDKPESLS